jgi:hypothetical protein
MTITTPTPPDDNNAGRRGKPYSLRISEPERIALEAKRAAAREHMPYDYDAHRQHGSMSHFLIWAALQWAPPAAAKRKALPRSWRRGTTHLQAKRKAKRPARRRGKKGGRK